MVLPHRDDKGPAGTNALNFLGYFFRIYPGEKKEEVLLN